MGGRGEESEGGIGAGEKGEKRGEEDTMVGMGRVDKVMGGGPQSNRRIAK